MKPENLFHDEWKRETKSIVVLTKRPTKWSLTCPELYCDWFSTQLTFWPCKIQIFRVFWVSNSWVLILPSFICPYIEATISELGSSTVQYAIIPGPGIISVTIWGPYAGLYDLLQRVKPCSFSDVGRELLHKVYIPINLFLPGYQQYINHMAIRYFTVLLKRTIIFHHILPTGWNKTRHKLTQVYIADLFLSWVPSIWPLQRIWLTCT